MNIKRIIVTLIFLAVAATLAYFGYKNFFTKKEEALFNTEPIPTRTITHSIKATGYLEPKDDLLRIGTLVSGIIRKMLVEENQAVKQGDILAEIDDGKEDTEVKETKAAVEQLQAQFEYTKAFYCRQKYLHEHRDISDDEFEKVTKDYKQIQAELNSRKAAYERAQHIFDNKSIQAPHDGLIIGKLAREGEYAVTLAPPATILYTIAKDITKMKAKLEIDESVIGNLKVHMTASLTFDTYPYQEFKGEVVEISNSPITENNTVSYYATVYVDNAKLLFRPGMTVNAEIIVAEKADTPAIPGYAFKINRSILKQVAEIKQYKINEATKTAEQEKQKNIRSVWTFKDKTFTEHFVTVGIDDNAFFELISGVAPTEQLVIDTIEPNVLKERFKKMFGRGL